MHTEYRICKFGNNLETLAIAFCALVCVHHLSRQAFINTKK